MPTEFSHGDYLIRVQDGVLEQFARSVATSYRVPMSWASAEFEQRRHDVVRVKIGIAEDPQASIFSSIAFTNTMFSLEIAAGEEATLRAFRTEAERQANRSV